ncbi:MAG TPA: chloride channel protein, partial [Candidatus Krumholzibacteria bacterium]|nr:chloride channel protein [Candidatus Krumholzibacteria bacterium]
EPVTLNALGLYAVIGVIVGLAAAGVTRTVYWLEDMFERLPVNWMWWPAIGGLGVGLVGYLAPRTLGVGYDNIADILSNRLSLHLIVLLCLMKFISWAIALSSGTSGGTLAPLFTVGSGAGAVLGAALLWAFPLSGLDVRVAALVGMAGIFAGASHALLASVVFAFETTQQTNGLLPLLAGSTLAYLAARMVMKNSIMTEKIARRGLRVPQDYDADAFANTTVGMIMETGVDTLPPDLPVATLADRIARHDPAVSLHQAWPLVDAAGQLVGIITRNDVVRSLQEPGSSALLLRDAGSSALVVAHPDESVQDAVNRMLTYDIGRVLVVSRGDPQKLLGYVSRTHLLATQFRRLHAEQVREAGWLHRARSWQRSRADQVQ